MTEKSSSMPVTGEARSALPALDSSGTGGRLASAGGLIYFVAVMATLAIASAPDLLANSSEVARFLQTANSRRFLVASYLELLALLALMVFAAQLAGTVSPRWLRTVAFGGAGLFVALHLSANAVRFVIVLHNDLAPETAAVLLDVSHVLRWAGMAGLALFLASATGSTTLARWLKVSATILAIGLAGLIPVAGTGVTHFPATVAGLWLAAVSIRLLRRREI